MKNFSLIHAPIKDLSQYVEASSVDIILTDPPYPKEYLHTWDELAAFSLHALKDGGHLFAMSGKTWLPEVLQSLNVDGLKYQWMLEYRMVGISGGCIGRRICRSYWKPIIWYTKGRNKARPMGDMVCGGGRDKRFHEWGQPSEPFLILLSRFVESGIVVCDPFVGGGAIAVATLDCSGTFIGADADSDCLDVTRDRIANHRQQRIPMGGFTRETMPVDFQEVLTLSS